MNDTLVWIGVTIVLAVGFHLFFVWRFPYVVMLVVRRVVGSPPNTIIHMPPTVAEPKTDRRRRRIQLILGAFRTPKGQPTRSVVRPSPDLLYSACIYDVSKTALRIRAHIPDTYWSISFFASNTDNYFVTNDRKLGSKDVTFLLVAKGRRVGNAEGALVVEAQSHRGVILLRALVMDPGARDDLIRIQKLATCEPVGQAA